MTRKSDRDAFHDTMGQTCASENPIADVIVEMGGETEEIGVH
jgi:hypothetical protein